MGALVTDWKPEAFTMYSRHTSVELSCSTLNGTVLRAAFAFAADPSRAAWSYIPTKYLHLPGHGLQAPVASVRFSFGRAEAHEPQRSLARSEPGLPESATTSVGVDERQWHEPGSTNL